MCFLLFFSGQGVWHEGFSQGRAAHSKCEKNTKKVRKKCDVLARARRYGRRHIFFTLWVSQGMVDLFFSHLGSAKEMAHGAAALGDRVMPSSQAGHKPSPGGRMGRTLPIRPGTES